MMDAEDREELLLHRETLAALYEELAALDNADEERIARRRVVMRQFRGVLVRLKVIDAERLVACANERRRLIADMTELSELLGKR